MLFFNKFFILLQYLLPQHTLSRLIGKLANCQIPWVKNNLIRLFIWHYTIDLHSAENPNLDHYACFNHFFTRKLKSTLRPIDPDLSSIISPSDGILSQFGKININQLIQAKKLFYAVDDLLADVNLANAFNNGDFATIYLSPRNYHRVHMPYDGKLMQMVYVPGKLFSVNTATANEINNLFTRNERLICLFETSLGKMAVIFVGAMIVAGIHTTWAGKITPNLNRMIQKWEYFSQNLCFKKGDELGYFELGSTVIILVEKNTIEWQALTLNQPLQIGQSIAKFAGKINGL